MIGIDLSQSAPPALVQLIYTYLSNYLLEKCPTMVFPNANLLNILLHTFFFLSNAFFKLSLSVA